MSPDSGGWRGGNQGDSPIRRPDVRSWRKPVADKYDKASAWRGFQSSGGLRRVLARLGRLMALALVIGFVIWIIRIPGCVQTRFIVASFEYNPIGNNAYPLPVNLYAKQDADLLASALPQVDRRSSTELAKSKQDILTKLAGMKPSETCLLYLAAFVRGNSAKSDELFFVTENNARITVDLPREKSLSLRELADALRSSPARHKLLLVDAGRTPPIWRFGQLSNAIHGTLRETTKDVKGLWIITSCRPDEQSWTIPPAMPNSSASRPTSPEPDHLSIFARSLAWGLRGDADEKDNKGNGDGLVSAQELYNYLLEKVDSWVVAHRSARSKSQKLGGQHPLLIKSDQAGEDFTLASVLNRKREKPKPVLDSPPVEKTPATPQKAASTAPSSKPASPLEELYVRHQQLSRQALTSWNAYHVEPLKWTELNFKLKAAEAWTQAGEPLKADEFIKACNQICSALEAPQENDISPAPDAASQLQKLLEWNLANLSEEDRLAGEKGLESAGRYLVEQAGALRNAADKPFQSEYLPALEWVLRALDSGTAGERGDVLRRRFEDQAFLGKSFDLSRNSDRENADRDYVQALDIARKITAAERMRNRLYAALPELAEWIAQTTDPEQLDSAMNGLHGRLARLAPSQAGKSPSAQKDPQAKSAASEPGGENKFRFSGEDPVPNKILDLFDQAYTLEQGLSEIFRPDALSVADISAKASALAAVADQSKNELASEFSGGLVNAVNAQALQRVQASKDRGRVVKIQADARLKMERLLQFPLLPAETRNQLRQEIRAVDRELQGREEQVASATNNLEQGMQDRAKIYEEWQAFWAFCVQKLNSDKPSPLQASLDQIPSVGGKLASWYAAQHAPSPPAIDSSESTLLKSSLYFLGALRAEDRKSRLSHGYNSEQGSSAHAPNPPRLFLSALNVHRLLNAAQRASDDFYAALRKENSRPLQNLPPDSPNPWFFDVASKQLEAAMKAISSDPEHADALAKQFNRHRERIGKDLLRRKEIAQSDLKLAPNPPRTEPIKLLEKGTQDNLAIKVGNAVADLPGGNAAIALLPVSENTAKQPFDRKRSAKTDTCLQGQLRNLKPSQSLAAEAKFQLIRQNQPSQDQLMLVPFTMFRGHLWVADAAVPVLLRKPEDKSQRYDTQLAGLTTNKVTFTAGEWHQNIIFVLDSSGSMRMDLDENDDSQYVRKYFQFVNNAYIPKFNPEDQQRLGHAKQGLLDAIRQIAEQSKSYSSDIAVLTFGLSGNEKGKATVLSDFGQPSQSRSEKVREQQASGGTCLFGGINKSLEEFLKHERTAGEQTKNVRNIIIVIGDGQSNKSLTPPDNPAERPEYEQNLKFENEALQGLKAKNQEVRKREREGRPELEFFFICIGKDPKVHDAIRKDLQELPEILRGDKDQFTLAANREELSTKILELCSPLGFIESAQGGKQERIPLGKTTELPLAQRQEFVFPLHGGRSESLGTVNSFPGRKIDFEIRKNALVLARPSRLEELGEIVHPRKPSTDAPSTPPFQVRKQVEQPPDDSGFSLLVRLAPVKMEWSNDWEAPLPRFASFYLQQPSTGIADGPNAKPFLPGNLNWTLLKDQPVPTWRVSGLWNNSGNQTSPKNIPDGLKLICQFDGLKDAPPQPGKARQKISVSKAVSEKIPLSTELGRFELQVSLGNPGLVQNRKILCTLTPVAQFQAALMAGQLTAFDVRLAVVGSPPLDLGFTREIIPAEGKLTVEFDPNPHDIKNLELIVTKLDAFQPEIQVEIPLPRKLETSDSK